MNPLPGQFITVLRDLGAVLLPARCAACDLPLTRVERGICLACRSDLPRTRFHDDPNNPVEHLFHGKVHLEAATAFTHFDRHGRVRHILHRLKYKGDQPAGLELGRLMGEELRHSERFATVDRVMAVPLHPRKVAVRGFNQSQVLIDGLCASWPLAQVRNGLMRVVRTPSQTRRNRLERWTNVKEAFDLQEPRALAGAHVLVVDDVITTGATLEGCIKALQQAPDIRVSVLAAACA